MAILRVRGIDRALPGGIDRRITFRLLAGWRCFVRARLQQLVIALIPVAIASIGLGRRWW